MSEKGRYEQSANEIEKALRLGIEVESDDATLAPVVNALTDKQVKWISGWLAGESIGKIPE